LLLVSTASIPGGELDGNEEINNPPKY
jgi:hypothetical protein